MKKTINIKAKRLIASALSSVMCLTVASSNAFAENDISNDITSASETAYITNADNDDSYEYSLTLSGDEFANLASEYGCFVTIGSGEIAEPQVSQPGNFTFTDKDDHLIVKDTPLLFETIQLKDFEISENITCVIISIASGKSINPVFWDIITANGQHTSQRKVMIGTQYRIYMRVTSNETLSENNKAWVKFYWTDKNAELVTDKEDEVV